MRLPSNSFFLLVTFFMVLLTFFKFIDRADPQDSRMSQFAEYEVLHEHNLPAQRELFIASRSKNNKQFYGKVKEEVACQNKVRIGGAGDGGKYVCNPGKVKENCTLLSLGLNNQIQYDVHIYNATGRTCKILGADQHPQRSETREKYVHMNGELFAGKIPNELTIADMLQKSGRSDVELLKIDIEGGEFEAVEPLLKEYFVCQIFIEIHGTPARHLQMLQILAKYKYRIFNVDENPFCPTCCEYSLISEKCMKRFDVTPIAITIPDAEAIRNF